MLKPFIFSLCLFANFATAEITLTNVIDRWVAQDALDPIPPGAVLFVGSSSIRRWESLTRDFADYRIIQRGFGGSQFSELNEIVDRIVLPYQPSAIVVFEGGNDIRLGQKNAGTVFADFKTFVAKVRAQLPAAPICFLSITPCPAFFTRPGENANRESANRLIAEYCASDPGLHLHFWDTAAVFESLRLTDIAAWNLHFVDDIHLNRAGYRQWLSVIRPALEAVIAPNKKFIPNPNSLKTGEKLLFDFGPSEAAVGDPTLGSDRNGNHWNNWHRTDGAKLINSGEHLANLTSATGKATGIRMTITGGFLCTGKNPAGGLSNPSPRSLGDLAIETAAQDYFYSTADDRFNGPNDDLPGAFMLDGLDPGLAYEFRFLGSRSNDEVRFTEFAVYGANEKRVNLQTSGPGIGSAGGNANDTKIAVVTEMRPDSFGQIFVDLTLLQGSNSHLNAMEIIAGDAVR